METLEIEIVQQIPVPNLRTPVVISQPEAVQSMGGVALFGREAALAQYDNLTKHHKPNTLGRTAIFVA